LSPATHWNYPHRTGEFANLDEHSVLALIAVMLLMAIFGCAIAVQRLAARAHPEAELVFS
jgi:hypothetical protein